jgi:hypothetical protein
VKAWLAAAALPIVLWIVVLTKPVVDERWESHPAHFWLALLGKNAGFELATPVGLVVAAAFAPGVAAVPHRGE